MKNIKKKRIILIIIIIIWAVLVFYFSNQGSDDSSGFSFLFTSIFIKNKEMAEIAEPYVRKIAHLCEYMIGGILFSLLFSTYDWKDEKIIAVSILVGAWYATLDEIHQLLVPGRAGRFVDVYLDTLGITIGVLLVLIVNKILEKIKKRKK